MERYNLGHLPCGSGIQCPTFRWPNTIENSGSIHGESSVTLNTADLMVPHSRKVRESARTVSRKQLQPGAFAAAKPYIRAIPVEFYDIERPSPRPDAGKDVISLTAKDETLRYEGTSDQPLTELKSGLYEVLEAYQ